MVTRSFDSARRTTPSTARTRFERGTVRYRLDVVGTTVADVVEHAGGWLFDRSLAGWEVTVLLTEVSDARALQILGLRVLDLAPVMDGGGRGREPHAVAVGAGVCLRDGRARKGLTRALADGGIEVVVWGEGWREDPGERVAPVVHRLSIAARTFKAHALAAAGLPDDTSGVETFHSGATAWDTVGADLNPVG